MLGECIELIHAQNADEAVELIGHFTSEDRPDLFMVDLRLPDNGGFSVLSAVRGSTACENVPLFVITSSGYDRDIAECYQLGASAVLCKPLSRAIFREEIARVGLIPGAAGKAALPHRSPINRIDEDAEDRALMRRLGAFVFTFRSSSSLASLARA